jgi:hypothetical protein
MERQLLEYAARRPTDSGGSGLPQTFSTGLGSVSQKQETGIGCFTPRVSVYWLNISWRYWLPRWDVVMVSSQIWKVESLPLYLRRFLTHFLIVGPSLPRNGTPKNTSPVTDWNELPHCWGLLRDLQRAWIMGSPPKLWPRNINGRVGSCCIFSLEDSNQKNEATGTFRSISRSMSNLSLTTLTKTLVCSSLELPNHLAGYPNLMMRAFGTFFGSMSLFCSQSTILGLWTQVSSGSAPRPWTATMLEII